MQTRFCIKFAYWGEEFYGYQRQPTVKTVEGEIINALLKTNIIASVAGSRFQSASRTDRAVSALANAIAFNTTKKKSVVMAALNAVIPNIWFHSIATVPIDFHPRREAIQRWYRYMIFEPVDVEKIKHASQFFKGTHDFKYFMKASPLRGSVKTIDSIKVLKFQNHIAIDFKARSFGWNMIRRIVNALQSYEKGDITLLDIKNLLAKKTKKSLGLAKAEYLILMDVKYNANIQFESFMNIKKLNSLYELVAEQKSKVEFYKMLMKTAVTHTFCNGSSTTVYMR